MNLYPINSLFTSIQGEGHFTGAPAAFIRFSGCNLNCPDCDTDHEATIDMMSIDILVKWVNQSFLNHIILTGGEPLLQDLKPLVYALKSNNPNYTIQIETNGTIPKALDFTWITCSPKDNTYLTWPNEIDELKFLITSDPFNSYNQMLDNFIRHHIDDFTDCLYIQPVWPVSLTQYVDNLHYAIDFVLNNPRFKLSIQIHKYLKIN